MFPKIRPLTVLESNKKLSNETDDVFDDYFLLLLILKFGGNPLRKSHQSRCPLHGSRGHHRYLFLILTLATREKNSVFDSLNHYLTYTPSNSFPLLTTIEEV